MAELDIENIVREVLARLRAEMGTGAKATDNVQQDNPKSTLGSLALSESLVTLDVLAGKLNGIKELVVRPKAVLTPAAKDLLRERKVKLVLQAGAGQASTATPGGKTRLVLATAATNYDASALAKNLNNEGIGIERQAKTDVQPVIAALADAVVGGASLGWLLTGEAPAAVCLANRKSGVRAAAASSIKDVQAAKRSAAANLIVTDPTDKSYWELLRIGREIGRGGAFECPAWLKT